MHGACLKNLIIMGMWNVSTKQCFWSKKKESGNQRARNQCCTPQCYSITKEFTRQRKQIFQLKIPLHKRSKNVTISHVASHEAGNKLTLAHPLMPRRSPVCTFYRSTIHRTICTYPYAHMSTDDQWRNDFSPVACLPPNHSCTNRNMGDRESRLVQILLKIPWRLTVLSLGWLFWHRQYSSLTQLIGCAEHGSSWQHQNLPRKMWLWQVPASETFF